MLPVINGQKWIDKPATISEQRNGAIWVVAYGLDKFYLTNKEKDHLLNSLQSGARFVEIKGNVLTDKFMYITVEEEEYNRLEAEARVRNKPEMPEFEPVETKQLTAEEVEEKRIKDEETVKRAREHLYNKGIIKDRNKIGGVKND